MLPKPNRVQKNKDFERIFKKSKQISTKNLSLRVAIRSGEERNIRFGFVVSNKVNKLAVRRNAIKRQLRQISQQLLDQIERSCDIVIMVKQDFTYPYDQKEIELQLREGLEKIGILRIK